VRSTSPKFAADDLRVPLASLSGARGHCDVIEGERMTADQAFGVIALSSHLNINSREVATYVLETRWVSPSKTL
jgi:hypothetical protein